MSKQLKIKGGEVGSVKELRKSLKRGGGDQYLSRIPADGRTVRFLTEPDSWFKYFEHYDDTRKDNYYFPCTEDCIGCTEGISASKRYLVNALDVSDNKVIPLVLPASLAANLLKKYDKFKTLTDRDYELTKDGTGFDTDYDALYDQPSKMNLKRYDLLDLGAILEAQLGSGDETEDDDDDEDDEPKAKKSKGVKKPPSRRAADDDDDDDDDDEDETPRKRTKTIAKPKSAGAKKAGGKALAAKSGKKKSLSKK